MSDTERIQDAISKDNLALAVQIFEETKSEHDARWIDHRSYELMRVFWERKDFENAYKFVYYARTEEGRIGRKKRTDELKAEHEKSH